MSKNDNPFKIHVTDSDGNFTTSGFTSDPKAGQGGRFTSVGQKGGDHYTWVRNANGALIDIKHNGKSLPGGGNTDASSK